MRRSPGDTTLHEEFITGKIEVKTKTSSVSTTNTTSRVMVDMRPTYERGTRSKIGNLLWQWPTSYTHHSREIKISGRARQRVEFGGGAYSLQSDSAPNIDQRLTLGAGYSPSSLTGTASYNVTSGAKVKALNSIGQQKANVGEDLATYLQTARMFSSKASLLHEILNAFKKGKLKKYLKKSAKEVAESGDKKAAQAYLEYVYGWKPLVSDLYGIYQALKEYADGAKPIIIHGHGTQKQSYTDQYDSPGSGTFKYRTSCDITVSNTGTCDLYGRVDPQYIVLRLLNQLGLLNPASLAWELTPWSFVVDWFVPVGPLIAAFTAPIGLKFVSGTVGSRESRVFENGVYSPNSPTTNPVSEYEAASFMATDELYSRDVLTTWPYPTPYLNLNPLSGDRSLKALALAIVNLKR